MSWKWSWNGNSAPSYRVVNKAHTKFKIIKWGLQGAGPRHRRLELTRAGGKAVMLNETITHETETATWALGGIFKIIDIMVSWPPWVIIWPWKWGHLPQQEVTWAIRITIGLHQIALIGINFYASFALYRLQQCYLVQNNPNQNSFYFLAKTEEAIASLASA